MSDTTSCGHVAGADPAPEPATPDACGACVAGGSTWVNLRLCLACGNVGCCDNSPARHATAHHHETGHPLIRSYEPGEDWWWCYTHEASFDVPDADAAPSHS